MLGLAMLWLGACGPAGVAPSSSVAGTPVTITGSFSFAPQQIEIARGSAVTWTNTDSTAHEIVSGTPATPTGKLGGRIEPGKTLSLTFGDAGTFEYFCGIHQTMRGTIVVR